MGIKMFCYIVIVKSMFSGVSYGFWGVFDFWLEGRQEIFYASQGGWGENFQMCL